MFFSFSRIFFLTLRQFWPLSEEFFLHWSLSYCSRFTWCCYIAQIRNRNTKVLNEIILFCVLNYSCTEQTWSFRWTAADQFGFKCVFASKELLDEHELCQAAFCCNYSTILDTHLFSLALKQFYFSAPKQRSINKNQGFVRVRIAKILKGYLK